MDRVTRAKLDSLVHELSIREPLGTLASQEDIEEIARRFQLDPMIVRRVAEQQGLRVGPGSVEDERVPTAEADPNQATQVMSLEELLEEQ